MRKSDVNNVRREVTDNIGRRVKIKANKGRRKISIAEGVITETYPSIFLIETEDDKNNVRTMSFSYKDVLTKDVKMMLC
ncbi:MAG: hypothetical protein GX323_06990 [Clostridiales bacterium]|nr:hypothetical protein [Clostridiales bacterium]